MVALCIPHLGLRADESSPLIIDFEGGALPYSHQNGIIVSAADTAADTRVENEDAQRGGVAILEASADGSKKGIILAADIGDVLYDELSSFTIGMRFRANPAPRSPLFFQRFRGSRSVPGFFAFYNQSNIENAGDRRGTFRFTATNTNGVPETVSSDAFWTIASDEWYHVTVTFDHGVVQFYLNGFPLAQPQTLPFETIPPLNNPARSLRAGLGFEGAVDDITIWPRRALSAAEVQELHEKGVKPLLENKSL